MFHSLEQYVKFITKDGYTVEKYKSVSNPCTNFAIYYSDKVLAEAKREGYARVNNLSIEINGPWQFLYMNGKTVGYDQWVKEIEKHLDFYFRRELGL